MATEPMEAIDTIYKFGIATVLGCVLALYQAGEESVSFLDGAKCTNSDLLQNAVFEDFQNFALPVAVVLYVFLMLNKTDKGNSLSPVDTFMNWVKIIVLHVPVIFILMQTYVILQSRCGDIAIATNSTTSTTDVTSDPIEFMAGAFLALGVAQFLVTIVSYPRMDKDDASEKKTDIIKIIDCVTRIAAYVMLVINIDNDTMASTDQTHLDSCDTLYSEHSHFKEMLPHDNKNLFKIFSILFLAGAAIEFLLHVLEFYRINTDASLKDAKINFVLYFSAAASRFFIVFILAGLVAERSIITCTPYATDENGRLKATVIIVMFTFFPSLLSQQTELERSADLAIPGFPGRESTQTEARLMDTMY